MMSETRGASFHNATQPITALLQHLTHDLIGKLNKVIIHAENPLVAAIKQE